MNTEQFGPEIESPNVNRQRDRFIVSLVFGMPEGDGLSSPEEAAASALKGLYLCPAGANHIWCVYDNQTGGRTLVQAEEVLPQGLPQALAMLLGHEMDEADAHRDLHAEMDAASGEPPVHGDREDALDQTGQAEVLSLIATLPWGDVEGCIETLDEAFRLAREATSHDWLRWENEGYELGFDDEFSVSPERVASLTDEWRLAYVGRLLESAAMMYGIQDKKAVPAPESPGPEPGSILRSLSAIVGRSLSRRRSAA
jgi:hypothetical protein